VLLKKALHSDQVKSTLVSLIALANQAVTTGKNGSTDNLPGETTSPSSEAEK